MVESKKTKEVYLPAGEGYKIMRTDGLEDEPSRLDDDAMD